jgi:hypothetical protein
MKRASFGVLLLGGIMSGTLPSTGALAAGQCSFFLDEESSCGVFIANSQVQAMQGGLSMGTSVVDTAEHDLPDSYTSNYITSNRALSQVYIDARCSQTTNNDGSTTTVVDVNAHMMAHVPYGGVDIVPGTNFAAKWSPSWGADLCFSKPKRITVQLLSKRMTVPCVWNGFNKTTTLSSGPAEQSTIESTGAGKFHLEMNCADAPPRSFPAPAQLGATLNDSTDMIERLYIQITTKDQ